MLSLSFFQYSPVLLRSYRTCLRLLPCLSVTSILLSNFPSVCLENSYYSSCDQSEKPSFFLLYVGYSSSPSLYVILSHFSRNRSNWSSSSFSSTIFQNFASISDLLSEVPTFQHHTLLCSKWHFTGFFFQFLSPVCWWKDFFLLNAAFAVANLGLISRVHLASFGLMLPK